MKSTPDQDGNKIDEARVTNGTFIPHWSYLETVEMWQYVQRRIPTFDFKHSEQFQVLSDVKFNRKPIDLRIFRIFEGCKSNLGSNLRAGRSLRTALRLLRCELGRRGAGQQDSHLHGGIEDCGGGRR